MYSSSNGRPMPMRQIYPRTSGGSSGWPENGHVYYGDDMPETGKLRDVTDDVWLGKELNGYGRRSPHREWRVTKVGIKKVGATPRLEPPVFIPANRAIYPPLPPPRPPPILPPQLLRPQPRYGQPFRPPVPVGLTPYPGGPRAHPGPQPVPYPGPYPGQLPEPMYGPPMPPGPSFPPYQRW